MPIIGPSRLVLLILAICISTLFFHISWDRSASGPRLRDIGKPPGPPESKGPVLIDPTVENPARLENVQSNTTEPGADNIYDVQNRTLGFQEIHVISLADRSDKHDAWAVAASVSDFDYEMIDGVVGADVLQKALPYTMAQPANIVGCWRAHMNVLQDMVNRKVSSLLIFEDDADWDVSLKSQLVQLARGTRWLLNSNDTVDAPMHSPYGDGWDFIWLGHCGARVDPWDDRRWVIPHDPTADPGASGSNSMSPDMYHWNGGQDPDIQTRIVISQYWGVCTASYAVTLEGAKKILYHLSMSPYNSPVDEGLSAMCKGKNSSFTCLGPYPPLIGVHRPAGNKAGWSDIETYEGAEETARSERVAFSTRMNMDRLLMGATKFKSQYAERTGVEEMDLQEIGRAVGHPEHVVIGEQDGTY